VSYLQLQEQLKTQIHVSETAFRSFKFVEDECKSKLLQSEAVNSVLKKQLEEKEQVLKDNNQKQAQLQTTVNGLTRTVESLNQTAELVSTRTVQVFTLGFTAETANQVKCTTRSCIQT
jgi:hypothetical protein